MFFESDYERKDEGNHGNFLFIPGDKERPIVGLCYLLAECEMSLGIDQSVTAISPNGPSKPQFEAYCKKVASLLEELETITWSDPNWSKVIPI